ncbi:MAG: BatD family protein [Candidatus Cryptobacteroides sp.]
MKRLLLLMAAAFLTATILPAQNTIKVETHNVVSEDEQFNVTFIIEGENNPTDFSWTPSEDFQLLWGPQSGRSTSVSIVNGKRTKSVQSTYTYVLKPVKAGTFQLPRATAKVKGTEISSSTVSIEVVPSGTASSRQSSGSSSGQQPSSGQSSSRGTVSDEDIFLEVSLNRTSVVVGEPVIATIKLYQRVNIAGFESANFPSFDGFWSQELEAPTNIEFARETHGGQIYNAALLRKYILIPQRQGTVTIDPAELMCLVNIRVSSGGNSIFDGFFDDYRTVRKKVASKPVNVKVSPLPAGAPASFAGGVGSFRISAKVSKDTLKTHEAASLLITVTGTGNVSLLDAPKVNFPPDMEVYDTKISEKVDKGGRSGSKFYEFPFIPRSHGDFVLEPVEYSYYDINSGKYVTLRTDPVPIHVERGNEADSGAQVVVPGSVRKDVRTLGSDIRFISTKDPSLVAKGHFLAGSALFWTILGLLVAAALICWATFRKIAARRADVAGTRNRKATKMAMKRLKLADTFLRQNLYTAFYEELHKALLGFISDKLNIPVAELSRDNMSEALKEGNVAQEHIDTFIALLDACEFARYSPDAGHDAMEAHYKSALDAISSIDSNMKSRKNDNRKAAAPAVMAVMLLILIPAGSSAQQRDYADSLWNAGNSAYSEGLWDEAVKAYSQIESIGLESASLYCNLGDAYFKSGNIPMAVLWYERALKLDPSYSDARYNLNLVNESVQDRIDPVPEFILKSWAKDVCWILDSDSWTVCFIVFFALFLAMLLLFLLAPSVAGRRTGFFTGIVMLLLAVSSISFALWQKHDYMRSDEAVVMRPVTSAKSAPGSGSAKDLFILHEGTKVKILDQVGSWNNIQLADGRQGWIPSDDIEAI